MSNVRLHPYEGSEPFCTHCSLPRKNAAHKPKDAIHLMMTHGTISEEFWTTDWTPKDLSEAIGNLLNSVYEPRCDVCNVHTEEADGWCGNCGNCTDHCEQHLGCPPREDTA